MEGPELQMLANKIIDTRINLMKKLHEKEIRTPVLVEELKGFSDEYLEYVHILSSFYFKNYYFIKKYAKSVVNPQARSELLFVSEEKNENNNDLQYNVLSQVNLLNFPLI